MRKASATTLLILAFALASAGLWLNQDSAESINPVGSGKALHTDLAGRQVWISKDVQRIVLPRSKDIYLLAVLLGAELPGKLAAWGPDLEIDDAEFYRLLVARFPQLQKIPVTGSVYSDSLDVEQMLLLQPDLVILDKFMLDRGYRYINRLEAAGLPLVFLDSSSDPLNGPQQGLLLLGEVLGKQGRARAIVEYIDGQIRQVISTIEGHAPAPPSLYLESGNLGPNEYGQTYGSFGVSGQQTSWGTILKALRVRNIAEGRVVGMASINPEALLQADPDVIVITGQNWSRWKAPGSMQLGFNVDKAEACHLLRGFTARPGWQLLSAVRKHRVYGVFHNTVSPTVFSGIQALAKASYPHLFANLDPEKNLGVFYARFMPLPYQGTWMCTLK